ncbi:MAG: tetratricopeptide repeat protein, partial [Chthoniobacterales bacterium]
IFWPFHLSADYVPADVAWIQLPAALITLAVFISAQVALGWKSRGALFGAALFWLALAPASNFIPLFRPAADRFLYLPLVGIGISVSALLFFVWSRRGLYQSLVGVCALSLCTMAMLTWKREAVFSNSLNLWRDTTIKSPLSAIAANNLGCALIDTENYQDAMKAFEKSLQITEGVFAESWAGAAIVYEKTGHFDEAEKAFQKAIAQDTLYARTEKLLEMGLMARKNVAVLDEIKARISRKQP